MSVGTHQQAEPVSAHRLFRPVRVAGREMLGECRGDHSMHTCNLTQPLPAGSVSVAGGGMLRQLLHSSMQSPATGEGEIAYVICTFTYSLSMGTRKGIRLYLH